MMMLSPQLILDDPARDWAAAVITNSGTSSDLTIYNVNRFAVNAKNNDYWSSLHRLNLFCGDQMAACMVPLKNDIGFANDSDFGFLAAQYVEANGLRYSGNDSITQYVATGVQCATDFTRNDTHIAVYSRSQGTDGCRNGHGSINGNNQRVFMWCPFSNGNAETQQYDTTANGTINAALGASYAGLITGSRTSNVRMDLYQGSTSIASVAATSGTLPVQPFLLYTYYYNVFVGPQPTQGNVAFINASYSLGSGLTQADMNSYAVDIDEFQTELGRNV